MSLVPDTSKLALIKKRTTQVQNDIATIIEQEQVQITQQLPVRTKTEIGWFCQGCNKNCCIIREECRCLCGHRLKEHPKNDKYSKFNQFLIQ
jgi:hypothetical protein